MRAIAVESTQNTRIGGRGQTRIRAFSGAASTGTHVKAASLIPNISLTSRHAVTVSMSYYSLNVEAAAGLWYKHQGGHQWPECHISFRKRKKSRVMGNPNVITRQDLAAGVDLKGHKHILGFVQTSTENKRSISQFLKLESFVRGPAGEVRLVVNMVRVGEVCPGEILSCPFWRKNTCFLV